MRNDLPKNSKIKLVKIVKCGDILSEKPFNFISFTDDELRLLFCIATSSKGWIEEQHNFMRRLEKELFDEE